MSIQISFINQLVTNEQILDPDIIMPLDPRWGDAMQAWDNADIFAVDCETYGQKKNEGLHPWKGKIRLIQVGLPDGKVIMVDLGGWDGCNADCRPIISKQFLPILKKYLKSLDKKVIGANLKFDLLFFKVKWGFEARNCFDLMLASQVLWAGLPVQHGLKAIASRLGIDVDKTEQMSEWGFPLNNNQLNYAAKDVKVLFPIYDKLIQLINDADLQDSVNAEMLALPCFVQFEFNGMPVDYDLLLQVLEKYKATTEIVLKPFTDLFPGVNPDSPQQVVESVKDTLKIYLDGTSQEYLAPYYDKSPELKALSLWRTMTTYIDYLENVKKCYFDGAVRGVYRQINPSGFGRSTCGADKKAGRDAVNLQNPPNPNSMPKELSRYDLPQIRSIFKTENEQLLVSDLSSAHARIAADASRDPRLLEIYNTGIDIHCVTAEGLAKLRGKDWDYKYISKARKDKSDPNQAEAELLRQVAKPTYYGSQNGQGWSTLKVTVKTDVGVDLSEKESKSAIKAWKEAYKGLNNFMIKSHEKVCSKVFTFTDLCSGEFGEIRGHSNRRLYIPFRLSDFKPDDPAKVKYTDCVSFIWHSCEADIIKYAMGWFLLETDKHPEWCVKLRNMSHDEVDATCNKNYSLDVASCLQHYMRNAMQRYIKSIPPDDMSAKPESLLVNSWVDK